VFVLNLVLLKVPEIDLMRGVVVCVVRRPLRLTQCGRPAGIGKATTQYGVGFHGAVMTSTTRRWSAVALTSGDGFHGTTMAGGVNQRQWLPRHGEGQWRRRPATTASTSRRRPAAASISGNGFHVMAKASGGVDQRQPDSGGLGSGPHWPKSGIGSFLFLKTDFSC
jgi:hypothetical protein